MRAANPLCRPSQATPQEPGVSLREFRVLGAPCRRDPPARTAMISRFFIDRPIFATVLSVVITLIGGIALLFLPIAQYPRITPPGVVDLHQLPRRQRPGSRRHGGRPDRAAGQRRAGHALHVVADGQRRHLFADRHVRHRHRPEDGPGHGAEPRRPGHAAAADAGAEPGHHDPQEDARHPDDRQLLLARRTATTTSTSATTPRSTSRTNCCASRASRTSTTRASATTASAPGSTRRSWRRAT